MSNIYFINHTTDITLQSTIASLSLPSAPVIVKHSSDVDWENTDRNSIIIVYSDYENLYGHASSLSLLKSEFVDRNLKILLVIKNYELKEVVNLLQEFADGCIKATARSEEFIFALEQLKQGYKYICSEIAFLLLEQFSLSFLEDKNNLEDQLQLKGRESQILQLIGEGLTNEEIANIIFVSRRTVEMYRNALLKKTNTKNTASLIKYALGMGWIK